MKPYTYFSKGMQMSAILKQDAHRVRVAHPERLRKNSAKALPSFDKEGKVIEGVSGVASQAMTARFRHALSTRQD